jgi:hypothetical protein
MRPCHVSRRERNVAYVVWTVVRPIWRTDPHAYCRAIRRRIGEQGYRPTLADIAPELAERAACAAREKRKRRTVALATEIADRVINTTPVILVPRIA